MYKLVIGKIENQGNRVLLYPKENTEVVRDLGVGRATTPTKLLGGFHVIASNEQANGLHEGDTIEYEPYGINFGWFSRVLQSKS